MGVLATPINALADGFNNFINGIGDFFTNLIDSLGTWFDDIGQWFANLGDSIGQWFSDLGNSIGQWFTNLIDDLNGIGEAIGGWFSELGNSIGQWFNDLFSTLGEILNYLNPFHENFFLKIAFIPSDGFISGKFDELKDVLDDRLPIIGTFTGIFESITEAKSESINSTEPTFTMELPSKWGGQTVQVINFDPIDPYVPYIKTLIRFFLWIPFIIKMYKRLPQVVY